MTGNSDRSGQITYTNRKGQTYYLCEVGGKGKTRLVFSREPRGKPVNELPAGWEPVESINAQVSLRRAGASPILEEEVQCVRAFLSREPRLAAFRVEPRKETIVVHEPQGGIDAEALRFLGLDPRAAGRAGERLSRRLLYCPVFRFKLIDPRNRTFEAERMCWRSSVDGWLSLHTAGPLASLARRYLGHLGKESFFELC